jgi:multidrug efflux system outer membrane protein
MTVKVLLTTLMVLSLGGCSLAPTVKKPEPSMPENWTSARLSADEKLPLDWWRGYGDPALVTLVEEALDANNDLQLAAARVAEARALLTGQQAERYPLLEVEGSAVRQGPSEESVNSTGGQPFNDIQVGGVLSYELDLWGRLANASEAARARLLASAANREAVRLAVIGEVANGYFNLRALDRQIDIAERSPCNGPGLKEARLMNWPCGRQNPSLRPLNPNFRGFANSAPFSETPWQCFWGEIHNGLYVVIFP